MWNDDREDRRKFEGDVWYEAWRRGLNPDRATDCATDCYYAGRTPENCVDGYASRVRAEREQREIEADAREYYAEMDARYAMELRERQEIEAQQPVEPEEPPAK